MAALPGLAMLLAATNADALGAAAFRSCLASSNTTCVLDAGTYDITTSPTLAPSDDSGPDYQPFVVSGTGLTVQGTLSGTTLATTLIRNDTSCSPSCTYNLMSLTGRVTSITIQDMLFDGNRALWGSTLNCSTSPPPGTVCANNYIDVDLSNSSPSSTYAIVVTDCTFQNSPNYSLETANDTAVTYSDFYSNFQTPLITYYMSGIGVYEDNFYASGGGAIALIATSTVSIQFNQFYWNHRECGDGNPGGEISVDKNSTSVTINNDYFDGGYGSGHMLSGCQSNGIEIYGAGDSILSNYITDHNLFAVEANGVSSLTFGAEPGYESNQIVSNYNSGISLGDDEGGGYQCSTSVTFGGDNISSNTGYGIENDQGSGCALTLYNLSGVTLSSNSRGATNFVCGAGGISCT